MTENQIQNHEPVFHYAIYLKRGGNDDVITNLDDSSVRNLTHYRQEVFDDLLPSNSCWGTILNSGIIYPSECSIYLQSINLSTVAVDPSAIKNPDAIHELLFCYIVSKTENMEIFSYEIKRFTQNILDSFDLGSIGLIHDTKFDELKSKMESWNSVCIHYILDIVQTFSQNLDSLIYACFCSTIIQFMDSNNPLKNHVEMMRYVCRQNVWSSNCENESNCIFVIDKNHNIIPKDSTDLLTFSCKLLINGYESTNCPFIIKKMLNRIFSEIQNEFRQLADLLTDALRDLQSLYSTYAYLRQSNNKSLILSLAKEYFSQDQATCKLISQLSHFQPSTVTLPSIIL